MGQRLSFLWADGTTFVGNSSSSSLLKNSGFSPFPEMNHVIYCYHHYYQSTTEALTFAVFLYFLKHLFLVLPSLIKNIFLNLKQRERERERLIYQYFLQYYTFFPYFFISRNFFAFSDASILLWRLSNLSLTFSNIIIINWTRAPFPSTFLMWSSVLIISAK